MPNSQTISALDFTSLVDVTGGAGSAGTPSQAELRQLAQQYCPQTYAQNRNATITRPLAERCLNEAGYGWAKSSLDRYFPRTR